MGTLSGSGLVGGSCSDGGCWAVLQGSPNTVLAPLFTAYTAVCDTESKFLKQCFEEQLKARVLRIATAVPAAAGAALQGQEFDIKPEDLDVWATAKSLFKTWTSAVGKKHTCAMLAALGDAIAAPERYNKGRQGTR